MKKTMRLSVLALIAGLLILGGTMLVAQNEPGPGAPPPGGQMGPGGPGGPGGASERGTLSVPQTYSFDLDNGVVTGGRGADVWFHAVSAVELYLEPMNGAGLALGNRFDPDSCRRGPFSRDRITLTSLMVGNFVCYRTDTGGAGQFRIIGLTPASPHTLTIDYRNWR